MGFYSAFTFILILNFDIVGSLAFYWWMIRQGGDSAAKSRDSNSKGERRSLGRQTASRSAAMLSVKRCMACLARLIET